MLRTADICVESRFLNVHLIEPSVGKAKICIVMEDFSTREVQYASHTTARWE